VTHLAPAEFVDLIDGTLAPARAAHAQSCVDCRARADAMRATLCEAAAIDVPEPPPFFFERFTAETRGAIAGVAPAPRWRDRLGARWMAVAATAAVVLAVVAGARLARDGDPAGRHAAAPAPASSSGAARIDEVLDSSNTEVWDVLVAAADDMAFEDAREAGMGLDPSAIDRAVQRMSDEERVALAQLLQSELKRSGD
jgi:hypothetical protein